VKSGVDAPAGAAGCGLARSAERGEAYLERLAAEAVVVLTAVLWLGPARRRSAGENEPVSIQTITMTRPATQKPATVGTGGAAKAPVRTPLADVRPSRASPQSRPLRDAVNRGVSAGKNEVLRFAALEPVRKQRYQQLFPYRLLWPVRRRTMLPLFIHRALPTAAGLTGLESGRILRLELPIAILLAYGFDVVPEAAARVVEADVLVGQDGQPRAIRLVDLDSDSRRKQ